MAVCACYGAAVLASVLVPEFPAGPAVPQGMGAAATALAGAASVGGLACVAVRRARPATAALIAVGSYAASTAHGAGALLVLPAVICLYSLGRHAPSRAAAPVGAVCAAATGLGGAAGASGSRGAEALASFTTFALVCCCGMVLRARERARETQRRGREAALRAASLEQERNLALAQSRVAAELHDSVGHSLTAIIALSEGLHGASGIPDVDEAIDLVNSLARDGLADTRNAVASLQSSPAILDDYGSGTVTSSRPEVVADVRGWDQLGDLLTTVRATGLSAALTETGRRPSNTAVGRALGELVYIVIREALTNVMRHAEGATRVVVSLDHTGSSTRVTVSDDGQVTVHADSSQDSHEPSTGHGLTNLASVIQERGGALEVGPSIAPGSGGWVLRAVVPVHIPDLEEA